MKSLRYIAVALLVLASTNALAWTAEVNKAVLMLAEENLSNKAKREVNALLGAPLSSIEFVNKGESNYRLDENGKSVTTDSADAVVRLEKAVAMLGDKSASTAERQKALREVAELADYCGSTAGILDYCGKSECDTFIVVTEPGILAEMEKKYPSKTFIPAPSVEGKSCNECEYMKMITLDSIIACLENESPTIELDEETRQKASKSIEAMVKVG